MTKDIAVIIGIVAAAFSAYFFIDNNYASHDALIMVEMRLDQKILEDQASGLQDRIWKIEDRCGKNPKDATVKEELRNLKIKLEDTYKKLEAIRKKK